MDIESIAKPVTKMAMTSWNRPRFPARSRRRSTLMRSGRPGPVLIDLPIDVQMAEIEFDSDAYEPLPVYKPTATRKQPHKALDMLTAAQRPLFVAGGGIINAGGEDLMVELAELLNVPVIPTLMGWGILPDDHELYAGMVGLQTSHRYGNATLLASDFVMGIGNRWANRHTGGLETYTAGRNSCTWTSSPRRSAGCSPPTTASPPTPGPRWSSCIAVARERKAAGTLPDYSGWVAECTAA